MHTTDREYALLTHQLAQHLLPGDHRYTICSCRHQLWMIWIEHKRGWNNDEPVDAYQVIGTMTNLYRHTDSLQGVCGSRGVHIAAGHDRIIALSFQHHLRYRRDALTAYTHKV